MNKGRKARIGNISKRTTKNDFPANQVTSKEISAILKALKYLDDRSIDAISSLIVSSRETNENCKIIPFLPTR